MQAKHARPVPIWRATRREEQRTSHLARVRVAHEPRAVRESRDAVYFLAFWRLELHTRIARVDRARERC